MKLLVIGGSGLVGSHLLRAAVAAGHSAGGTYRRFPVAGLVQCDCADAKSLACLLDENTPDAVIHAAGWTWVDGCEDDPVRALEENASQPERLGRLCHARGIRYGYFSTSYVFDGTAGPYDEQAQPAPINVYSRSKWEGEQRVQAACDGSALIARVICVYGAEAQKKNFAYQVWRAMAEGKTLRLPSDQRGNPTWAADIGRWMVALLERQAAGVWNLGGDLPDCSRPCWAGMLVQAYEGLGVRRHPEFVIETVPTAELKQKALRPLKAGMVTAKLAALGMLPTAFADTVRQMFVEDPQLGGGRAGSR